MHGLDGSTLCAVSACVVVWGLVSARLERAYVSAPIAFVVMGLVLAHGPWAPVHLQLHSTTIRSLAELTLAVVLFADASRVNPRVLRAHAGLPARLLGIGLPLTLLASAGVGALLLGGGAFVPALAGAIVSPTDAALGAAVVQDERVPAPIRRSLNVESGLNDGLVTPIVNVLLAAAVVSVDVHATSVASAAIELVGGAVLGTGVGTLGGLCSSLARRRGWSAPSFRPFVALALALLAYGAALLLGWNGFVAAFLAGMAFGAADRGDAPALELTEEAGTLLSLLVWFIFGAVMLVPGLRAATWQDLAFAVLALTAARMVPVGVSLLGSGVSRPTALFLGWFGPRGLASVVFGLLAVDALDRGASSVVLGAVVVTVALSVLAHGVSASPAIAAYARRLPRGDDAAPERAEVAPVPVRALRGRPPAATAAVAEPS